MWGFFYRNSRLLILTICLILVWGISSWQILPRMEDPEYSQWGTYIITRLPGASAYRVESLVTDIIEQELLEINEIKTLESSSRVGNSTVSIRLKDRVKNHDEVWSRVRDRLADVTTKLPPDTLEPEYIEATAANTLIAALTWNLESPVNYAILRRWAQELEDELRNLPGTEQVELFGAPSEEIVVEINPVKLASMGLTPQQLSEQISLSDAKVAAGQLRSNNNLLLEVQTQLDHLERIRQIPIRAVNGTEQLVRLGDLALVKKGIREPPSQLALIDNKPAIALAVLMEPNQRIDRWSKTARQTLDKFRARLPLGIDLQLIFDQSRYVNHRLNNLFKNLILGALCVVGSTLFMMGWRSALVVGSALPLSVLMVLGGMRVLEIPLHQMSVTGLVIALGLLIDNAIVVVDEIQNLLQKGFKPPKAISQTIRYLAIPLLASTLTTVLTFMPMVLVSGVIGEFVNSLGISVILALLSSLFLSLTIVPALIGRIKKKEDINKESKSQRKYFLFFLSQRNWWTIGFSHSRLTSSYRQLLSSILVRPIVGITLSLILPLTGFFFASTLPEQFFPPSERDQFPIELELPTSASLSETQAMVQQAQEIILRHPEVLDVHWFIGTNAPKFYLSLPNSGRESPNYANGIVQITSASESRRLIQSLQQELDEALPSAQVFLKQLGQSNQVVAPVVLRLYGSDLNTLQELGNQTRSQLAQITNVTHTKTSLGETLPKLALSLDEEQAQFTGLDHTQIAQQLHANLEGNIGGSLLEDTEELPVRVRLANSDRANLDQITTLDLVPHNQLSSENSASVPLSALGQINLVPETAIITRRNGQRINTVQGFITAGVLPSTVLADFQQRLNDSNFQLPPGYSMEWGGESATRNEAVGNLLSTAGILIVLMVFTLVLSFNSFRSAGIVFLVAIGSVGLALASLWFFGYPLGFMSILGTVGLIGVAINDSIVVLAAIRNDPQARKGDRPAMVKVIVRSTRHVLTTTITTVAGFIPLLLDGGELWPPLAICITGGVGGATLLALFFVPCAYLLLIDRNNLNSLKLYRKTKIMKDRSDKKHKETELEPIVVHLNPDDTLKNQKFTLPARKIRLLLSGLLVFLLIPLGRNWLSKLPILSTLQPNQAATPQGSNSTTILPVETMKVNLVDSYQVDRTYTGTIVPRRTSSLGFERSGKIMKLTVDQGDRVKVGTHIALLDPKNLKAQQQELLAERKQVNALLKELQAGSRSETIAAAQSTVNSLQSQLKLAQTKSQRRQELYPSGAISREQLDEATTEVNTLNAQINEAQSQLDELLAGTRPEKIEAQQAVLQKLDAKLASLELELEQSTLKAPFTGKIANRLVDEGTVVSAGESIFTLVEASALEAHIGVPVNTATQIPLGSNQQLQIGARTYQAQVISTLPQLDSATRTLTVVLGLDESAAGEVRAGQVARLKLSENITDSGYWLPTTALVRGVRGLWSCYVLGKSEFVANDPQTAFRVERREIEVLQTESERVFVRGTLQNSDQVIVNGNHRLVTGQLVRPVDTIKISDSSVNH